MKKLPILSIFMALSYVTNMFSANTTSQTESVNSEPVFKLFALKARGEANYCCNESKEKQELYGKYLSEQTPEQQAKVEKLKQENRKICCGRSEQDTSHVITIIKNPHGYTRPRNSEQSETMITPLNPNGVSTSDDLWKKRWGLFSKDEALDNGASLAQNPATDSDIWFLGGSFEQHKLIAKLAINAECRASRLGDRSLGQNELETSVYLKCPNATYRLRHLAKKSVDELVKHLGAK